MDKLIEAIRSQQKVVLDEGQGSRARVYDRAARRLEECHAFFERFAAGDPPPEGTTYEEWARELLA